MSSGFSKRCHWPRTDVGPFAIENFGFLRETLESPPRWPSIIPQDIALCGQQHPCDVYVTFFAAAVCDRWAGLPTTQKSWPCSSSRSAIFTPVHLAKKEAATPSRADWKKKAKLNRSRMCKDTHAWRHAHSARGLPRPNRTDRIRKKPVSLAIQNDVSNGIKTVDTLSNQIASGIFSNSEPIRTEIWGRNLLCRRATKKRKRSEMNPMSELVALPEDIDRTVFGSTKTGWQQKRSRLCVDAIIKTNMTRSKA